MKKCDVCHYREALITGLFSSSMVSSSRSTRLLSPPPSPASPPLSSSYASPIHMDRVTSGDLGFGHDHNPLLEQEFEQIRAMKAEYDHIVLQDEEYVETLTGLLERRLESALDPNTNYVTKQSIAELQYALKEKRRHREVLQQEQERLKYMKAEILRRKNELNGKIHERQKTAMAVEVKRELLEQHLYPMIKKQSEVLLFRRMEVVMGLFKAMPIAVDADSSRWDTLGTKVKLRGYSSIMGLPLPNHGLFDAISVDIVSAALSRVAQLTEAIATALNIPLPHSIYTNHHSGNALIIPMYAEGGSALMLAPINWNVTRDSFRDFQWMSLDEVKEAQSRREKMQNNGMNMTKKEEDDINVLRDDIHVNATFSQALRLLQADIVSLCVKMGLPAAGLWPPSALLLNLHALKEHVEQYVAGHTQEVQTEAASPPSSPPRLTKTTFYLGGGKANQKSNNNSHANLNLDSISAEDIVLNAASVRDMDSLLNARFYQHAVSHSVDSSLLQIVSDELQQDDVPSSSKEKIIPEVEDGWDVIDFDD